MAKALGAMTGKFATPPMCEDERAGQSIVRDAKLGQQKPFATLQASGIWARWWIGRHLIVIILSDKNPNNTALTCFLSVSMESGISPCQANRQPRRAPIALATRYPQNG
jgi:hypothetical protein